MKIPRFWAKAQDVANGWDLTAWGWSESNIDEARSKARERLGRMKARVARGEKLEDRYPYGVNAIREEIIDEIEQSAVITRNAYGSLVLNAAHALFIDVDVPETKKGFLGSLFGKKPDDDPAARNLAETLKRESSATFRIYRTAAGLRVMGTEKTYEPGSAEAEALMNAVGADPQFVQLCRAQRSFRARLTPKPWRCGVPAPPKNYPREDFATDREFQKWVASYDRACADKGTCRFVEQVGTGRVSSEIAPLLRLHDEKTKASQGLELA